MIAEIEWRSGRLAVDFSRGRSLAIALDPGGQHPSFFADSRASARPLERDGFVGRVAQGGSCNAEIIEFSTHSHGTHTECIGHISPECHSVMDTIDQEPTLLRLVSLPRELLEHGRFIPAGALDVIHDFDGGALAVRTQPNDPSKQWRDYDEAPDFPVFSAQAMQRLSASTLLHLLIDTPSIDTPDSKRLENHTAWWGLDARVSPGVTDATRRSVTELIYVPDDIVDGDYWLDLQLAPFVSDAVPSRPVIYPLERPPA